MRSCVRGMPSLAPDGRRDESKPTRRGCRRNRRSRCRRPRLEERLMEPRILAGPPAAQGPETFRDHAARLGAVPRGTAAQAVIPTLEASGLLGRGGAGFPVGRKWRSVAEQAGGAPIVLVTGAEGEPLSAKDRTLLALRPHLVLDGAFLAADAVRADRIGLYIGAAHRDARASVERALRERRDVRVPVELFAAPHAYVSGEETAAVHYVNAAD